jgi:hypothetical protein
VLGELTERSLVINRVIFWSFHPLTLLASVFGSLSTTLPNSVLCVEQVLVEDRVDTEIVGFFPIPIFGSESNNIHLRHNSSPHLEVAFALICKAKIRVGYPHIFWGGSFPGSRF